MNLPCERYERILAVLLMQAYDELADPDYISDPEKEQRVRELQSRILDAVVPCAPLTDADREWAASQWRKLRGHAWRADGPLYICDTCGAVSPVNDDSECRLAQRR